MLRGTGSILNNKCWLYIRGTQLVSRRQTHEDNCFVKDARLFRSLLFQISRMLSFPFTDCHVYICHKYGIKMKITVNKKKNVFSIPYCFTCHYFQTFSDHLIIEYFLICICRLFLIVKFYVTYKGDIL